MRVDTAFDLNIAFLYLQNLRETKEVHTAWLGLVAAALGHMVLKEYENLSLHSALSPTETVLFPVAIRLTQSHLIRDVLQPLNNVVSALVVTRAVQNARNVLVPPTVDRDPLPLSADDDPTAQWVQLSPVKEKGSRSPAKSSPGSKLTINSGYCGGAIHEGRFPIEPAAPGPLSWDTLLTAPWVTRGSDGVLRRVPSAFRTFAPSQTPVLPRLRPSSPIRWARNQALIHNNTLGLELSALSPADFHRSYLGEVQPPMELRYTPPEAREPAPGNETIAQTLPICIPPMHLPPLVPAPQPAPALPIINPIWPDIQSPSTPFNAHSSPTPLNGSSSSRPPALLVDLPRPPFPKLSTATRGVSRGRGRGRGGRIGSSVARQPSAFALDAVSHDLSPDETPAAVPNSPVSPLANKRKRPYKPRPRKRKSNVSASGANDDDAEFKPPGSIAAKLDGPDDEFKPTVTTRKSNRASTASTEDHNADANKEKSLPEPARKRRATRRTSVLADRNDNDVNV